jgi:hypothetical protein
MYPKNPKTKKTLTGLVDRARVSVNRYILLVETCAGKESTG